MVNRRSKGMATMRKARALGEGLGYKIEQAPHSRFTGDYFGMFDQIWLRNERLIFVQIKTNQSIIKSMKKIFEEWSEKHIQKTMIMNWSDKKGEWQILIFSPTVHHTLPEGENVVMFKTNTIR